MLRDALDGSAAMKRFLDLGDFTREEVLSLLRARAAPGDAARAARAGRQDPRTAVLQSLAAHARLLPGGDGAPGRQLLRHQPRPGQLAARDARRRRHGRRRRRARARGHPGARLLLRRARHPRLRRRQGSAQRIWRRPTSTPWRPSPTSRSSTSSRRSIIPARRSPTGRRSMTWRCRAADGSCSRGPIIRARCRSRCRRRRCTWRLCAAWR